MKTTSQLQEEQGRCTEHFSKALDFADPVPFFCGAEVSEQHLKILDELRAAIIEKIIANQPDLLFGTD